MSQDAPASRGPPQESNAPLNCVLITLIVAAMYFMELLDSTIIVTALPRMAEAFHTTAVRLSLGLSAYLLATAVFLPASGWIADHYGTRRVFGAAILMFLLTSLACGLSRSAEEFIAARSLQGIAAALMSPVGRLVVLRTTPREQLVRITNYLVIPALVGPLLGPPIGGFITTYASWRWVFFINVPIGLVGMALVYRYLPNLTTTQRRSFDIGGFILNGIAMSASIYGLDRLSEGGASLWIGGALMAVGLAFAWIAIVHARGHTQPLMPLAVTKIKTFMVSNLGSGALFRIGISAPMFMLPLMLQLALGMNAFSSGLLIFAHAGGDLLLKAVATRWLRRFGFRKTLIWSAAGYAFFMAGCALFTPSTPYWLMGAVLCVAGGFRSLQMTALNALQFADIPSPQMTEASTLSSVAQQLQRAFGIATGALLLNALLALRAPAHALSITEFQIAFLIMAAVAAGSILGYRPLRHDTGAALIG